MKKLFCIFLIVLLLSLNLVSTVFAKPSRPFGGCKPGYTLQLLDKHLGESANLFLSPALDRNGDGYICAQFYLNGQHRHLDNFNRLRCR
jgi:hypothetical protein